LLTSEAVGVERRLPVIGRGNVTELNFVQRLHWHAVHGEGHFEQL